VSAARAASGRSWRFCAGAAVLWLLATPGAQQPPDRLTEWRAAVEAHEPGTPDKAVIEVSTWSGEELDAIVALAKRDAVLLGRTRPAEANESLLRAAVMHADIGRLIPEDTVRRSAKQRRLFLVLDGREQGTRFISIHWEIGRSLLDGIAPGPASLPGVLQWYRETSADLLRLGSLAEAVEHLPRARRIFPSDPEIMFMSGLLHERFSSPALQAAAAAVVANARGATSLSPARAELGRAERFFRETVAIQPDHLEARVRHGHVLGELGQHEPSVEALRAAIREGATGKLLYLAELFLGRQEEVRNNGAAARAHFERAAGLYPLAQSPRLALSQLSRRAGDRSSAQRELRVLMALPEDERQREDPWWHYYDAR